MRIFLLGFMGSGKSYVGKQLAAYTSLPFIDLDEWVEKQQQRSITTIFATDGEAAFREIERNALHEMIQFDNILLSTGGGTPCFFDNMAWMNKNGITIYLETPVKILVERLLPQQDKRPLIKGLDEVTLNNFILKKLTERAPFYEQAQVIYRITSAGEDVAAALFHQFKNIIGH